MDLDIDELLVSSLVYTPPEPVLTTAINDPAFKNIYEFLRDPLRTTLEKTNPIDSYDFFDTNSDLLIGDYLQSATVYPVWTFPSSNESQTANQEQLKHEPIIQNDNSKSGKIEIISNPRSKFRPRTEKESKDSSHYIRCEEYMPFEYPTILIQQEWKQEKNIIEVTLVDKDKNPHPYTLDNKECKTSRLIFKQNEQNSLYFHVIEQDYKKGQKSFLIEYIKPKQDEKITKELIKKLQLEQSMLRFTRFYQIPDGTYQQDSSSVEYSCLMTEDYGDFSIEDVFPLYGPMCGDKKVCVELKGYLPKDLKTDLIINIIHNEMSWSHQIENIKKNRNSFTFLMPPFPNDFVDRAEVSINISYKQEIIHQSIYKYSRKIDEELFNDDLNNSITAKALTDFHNEFTGALPISSSTGMGDEIRSAKRSRQ